MMQAVVFTSGHDKLKQNNDELINLYQIITCAYLWFQHILFIKIYAKASTNLIVHLCFCHPKSLISGLAQTGLLSQVITRSSKRHAIGETGTLCIERYSRVSILLSYPIIAFIGQSDGKPIFFITPPSCEHLHVCRMNT